MRGDTRGLSPVIGTALIVTIVLTLSLATVVTASFLLDTSQAGAQTAAAEQSFSKFDAKMSLVALSYGTDRARYDFGGLTTDEMSINNSGWVRVRIRNESTGATEDVLVNRTFNNIEYTNPQTGDKIVYQGGGVWKTQGDNETTMISTPEFRFRGRTITIPLVAVEEGSEIGNSVTMKRSNTQQFYPDRDKGLTNPLARGSINVTVKSRFYQSWGEFFVERTSANVTYVHDRNIVHATIEIPVDYTVENAIASKASGQTMILENNQDVDAYDSDAGPYSSSRSEDAKIAVASDIILENKAQISASVLTQGRIDFDNNKASVTGDVFCDNAPDCVQPPSRRDNVGGDIIEQNVNITTPPAGPVIDDRLTELKSNNDNDDENTISGNRIDTSSDNVIESGDYYLTQMQPGGDSIVFDTTDGNITIVVDNNVRLEGTDIDVQGDGRVNIYMDGKTLFVGNNATITTGGEDATQFWIFGPAGSDINFEQGNTKFVGVVYAPSSGGETTEIRVVNGAQIYGGLVGYVSNIGNSAGVHYDEALLGIDAVPEDEEVSYVTYVHITVNEVTITDNG